MTDRMGIKKAEDVEWVARHTQHFKHPVDRSSARRAKRMRFMQDVISFICMVIVFVGLPAMIIAMMRG